MIHRNTSKTPTAIYWWFLQVVLVLALASVVVWLSLIPKPPSFTISDFHIPAALNTTNSTVSHRGEVITNTSVAFTLEISNPNKGMGIHYNHIYITVYGSSSTIGTKHIIPGFYQSHEKSLRCSVLITAGKKFWRGTTNNGTVEFRVCLETRVRYRILRWKTKKQHMDFEGFVRTDPQGTMMIGGEKNIKLHSLRR